MVSSNTELRLDALRRLGISPGPFQRTKNDGANSRHHALENPMRILIYASDSDKEARQLIEELRTQGHHASLRNAQFYAGEIEPADGVVVRHGCSQNIVEAYEAAGKEVRFFGFEETQAVDEGGSLNAELPTGDHEPPQDPEPKPKALALNKMSKAQLVEEAARLNVAITQDMSKAQIVAAIEAAGNPPADPQA
jgi:hypothetical protein